MKRIGKIDDEKKQWIVIGCVATVLLLVLAVAILCGFGTRKDDQLAQNTENADNDEIVFENTLFEKTYDEFRTMINKELSRDNEYGDLALSEFKEVGTDKDYQDYEYLRTNLYKSNITDGVDVYAVANGNSGVISQIRYSVNIKDDASNARLLGWLLGRTMSLMYGDAAKDGSTDVINELSLQYPYEGMNTTYTYHENIYRSTLQNDVLTIYITDTDISYLEERKTAIITYAEQAKKDAAEAEAKRKAEEQARQELAKKERTFTAGNYRVGSDIDSGTYDIVVVSGRGNCFVRNTSGRSVVNEIFGISNDDMYIREYKNVELYSGYSIEIGSSLKLKFVPVK